MPVTIRPRPDKVGVNADSAAESSYDLLQRVSAAWTVSQDEVDVWGEDLDTNKKIGPEGRRILHSSFGDLDEKDRVHRVVPYGNGFVDGILRAFQQDLHLVVRPDDVWLAILVQFSFYVNGHAEQLRHGLVHHDGKKTMNIEMEADTTLENMDINLISKQIRPAMQGLIVDESLTEWLLPEFSTTTTDDRTVAALTLMATLKSYFEYRLTLGCGFPSVTLEGEKSDWEELAKRIQRFGTYGTEPTEWATYLSKILEKMIQSFDKPDAESIKEFWMQTAHAAGYEGSGAVETLSGWISAFCFWDDQGRKIHAFTDEGLEGLLWATETDRKRLIIDGLPFPVIRRTAIPKAISDVPLLVDDLDAGITYHTTLISGLLGMQSTNLDDGTGNGASQFQPRSGWWMLMDKTEPLVCVDPTTVSFLFGLDRLPTLGICL
ncbi:hypothetical protein V2G26_018246 [Clonostachys chloroleuca]